MLRPGIGCVLRPPEGAIWSVPLPTRRSGVMTIEFDEIRTALLAGMDRPAKMFEYLWASE